MLDEEKLLGILARAKFDVILYKKIHHGYFNWFDLLYRGTPHKELLNIEGR